MVVGDVLVALTRHLHVAEKRLTLAALAWIQTTGVHR